MSEYIDREAAIKEQKRYCGYLDDVTLFRLELAIKRIPAADVRPVVLCRDCKHNYNTCLNHGKNEPMCDFTDRKLREDDFCSRGEKREKS